ncbi:MAG: leucine-rich repeat protein [Clostridia bacterium]|nr:leucine-rich repeat protein [Clostridia bacterium]
MAISADIFLYHASNFISKVGRFIFGVAKAALTEGPAELLCELVEEGFERLVDLKKRSDINATINESALAEEFSKEFLDKLYSDICEDVGINKKRGESKHLSEAILARFSAITEESVGSYSCLELLSADGSDRQARARLVAFLLECKRAICEQYAKNLKTTDIVEYQTQALITYECFRENFAKDFNFEHILYEPIIYCTHCGAREFTDFGSYVICNSCNSRINKIINSVFTNAVTGRLGEITDSIDKSLTAVKDTLEAVKSDTGETLAIVQEVLDLIKNGGSPAGSDIPRYINIARENLHRETSRAHPDDRLIHDYARGLTGITSSNSAFDAACHSMANYFIDASARDTRLKSYRMLDEDDFGALDIKDKESIARYAIKTLQSPHQEKYAISRFLQKYIPTGSELFSELDLMLKKKCEAYDKDIFNTERDFDVFIMYISEDLDIVSVVANQLEARGLTCFYSERNLLHIISTKNNDYFDVLKKVMHRSKCLLFVSTATSRDLSKSDRGHIEEMRYLMEYEYKQACGKETCSPAEYKKLASKYKKPRFVRFLDDGINEKTNEYINSFFYGITNHGAIGLIADAIKSVIGSQNKGKEKSYAPIAAPDSGAVKQGPDEKRIKRESLKKEKEARKQKRAEEKRLAKEAREKEKSRKRERALAEKQRKKKRVSPAQIIRKCASAVKTAVNKTFSAIGNFFKKIGSAIISLFSKTKISKTVSIIIILTVIGLLGIVGISSLLPQKPSDTSVYNSFGYSRLNGEITITKYTGNESSIELPSEILGEPVTRIAPNAFENCTSLKSVTVPDSVTSIGDGAFGSCTSLTSVTIGSGVTSIGGSVFNGCSSLTNITIPNSVTSIANHAFDGCKSLVSVTIPDSVTYIGTSAFKGCTSLEKITLPFVGAGKDGSSNTHFGYIFGAPGYSSNENYVPKSLKNVVITSTSAIAFSAFENCSSITSITIPNNTTSIGAYAFAGCKSLTSITIPDSVTNVGISAFKGCTSLEKITLPFVGFKKDSTDYTHFGYIFGASDYTSNKTYVPASLKEVVITDAEVIGDYAFRECDSLVTVSIPYSITSIGRGIFWGCNSLNYNSYDNAYYLGNYDNPFLLLVAAKNTSITSCTINDTTRFIHTAAFYGCNSLANVTIPNSVTFISDNAFQNCTGLTSITIPNSVASISYHTFLNCTSLTINCEAASKPDGWHAEWNRDNRPVNWGVNVE